MLFTSGSFLRAYGDVSMKLAKEITRDAIAIAAPQKTCPSECKPKKKIYNIPDFDIETTDKICDNKNDTIYYDKFRPYDFKKKTPNEKDYAECEIGYKGKNKPTFKCKWNGGLRPVDEPDIINSSVPCHYLRNRTSIH